jgi:hypothetical protein
MENDSVEAKNAERLTKGEKDRRYRFLSLLSVLGLFGLQPEYLRKLQLTAMPRSGTTNN